MWYFVRNGVKEPCVLFKVIKYLERREIISRFFRKGVGFLPEQWVEEVKKKVNLKYL